MAEKRVLYIFFLIAFISFFSGCTKSEDEGVIASKRAKVEEVELEDSTPPGEEVIVDAESGEFSAPAPQGKTGDAEKAVTDEKKVTEEKEAAEKTLVKKEAAPQKEATQAKTVRKADTGARNWIVNVASLTDQRDAFKLKSTLSSQGYNAYVVVLKKNGKVWHRVRVGFYATREEAARVGEKIDRLNKDIKDPWVAKADTGELKYSR